MSDFEALISGLRAEQESLREPLARSCAVFQAELARVTADWFQAKASETVKTHAETTVRLGRKQIATMKQELAQLVASVPDLIEQEFQKPKYWFHLQPAKDGNFCSYKVTDDGLLDTFTSGDNYGNACGNLAYGLAIILGNIAPLLKKFGFINSLNEPEFQDREGSHRPMYMSNVKLSPEAVGALRDYARLVSVHRRLTQDLAKAERERLMAEAAALWDT